jgi:hypothetical protein
MTQHALALPATRPAASPVRALRGLLRFDSEAAAEAWLDRHGRIWCISRGLTLTLRPRQVGEEWLVCSWWSGHPYALEVGKRLRKMRGGDVR